MTEEAEIAAIVLVSWWGLASVIFIVALGAYYLRMRFKKEDQ